MLNPDPKRPSYRIVVGLIGIAIVGAGLYPILSQGSVFYENWFGGLVFCPLAIIGGSVMIWGALFKPEILDKSRARQKRK
jgi:hypothetical protein